MIKHTQTNRRQFAANCLTVFDHFVGLAFNGLNYNQWKKEGKIPILPYFSPRVRVNKVKDGVQNSFCNIY